MRTRNLQTMLAVMAVASLTLSAVTVQAQNPPDTSAAQPAAAGASAVPLSYGLTQVLQLAQAKVGDTTIIAYIKNSGNSYDLSADQIIYLRQQGLSDAVITTMLNQPRAGMAVAAPAAPAPPAAATPAVATASTVTPAPVATTTVAPAVTYVQTVPAPVYYYSQPYYYPAYAWFPPVSFSFGWGGGWHGGWHGGGWHH